MQESQSFFLRLSAINAAIAEGLSRDAVFGRIVESVRLLGFERVRVDLLSADGTLLMPVAGHGLDGGLGGPVQAAEDACLARLKADARCQIMGEHACIPILRDKKLIGRIWVDNALSHKALDEERVHETLHFAHQVALADSVLQRNGPPKPSPHSGGLEKKLLRLERLAQATREMMGELGTMSLRERLAMIAERAAEILEAEASGVFLVAGEDLVLEASYGHRGDFEPGKPRLKIQNQPGGGLTGWIAYHGWLFNAYGDQLRHHPAVALAEPHTPAGECRSLLAIPLKRRTREGKVVGLLRADNKRGEDGTSISTLGFTQEDEWILTIFAESALVAIEGAEMVDSLKEQREFLKRLIASSPDGIIAVDQQGRVTEFNAQAEEILGYTRKEVLGQSVLSLYFDPKEPYRVGLMLRDSPDGYLRSYDTAVRSKKGEQIPIRHASTWLFDVNGNAIGSVGYFEDLRAQRALQRRESLLLEASNALAEAEGLDLGLQRLAEMMVSELGRSFCGILLVEEAEFLILRAGCLRGHPDWTSKVRQIGLAQWDGLEAMLEAGRPWTRKSGDGRARPLLDRLTQVLGFGQEIEELLVVPLKSEGRVVGQLNLGDLQGTGRPGFSREEIDLVAALAAQITVLIEKFQLLETTVRREQLLEALVVASRHIRSDVEIPTLYQVIVRLATELVGCRTGILFRNRPHLGQLERAAIYPDAIEDFVSEHLSHDDGLIGQVARSGEITIHPDPQSEELFRNLDLSQVAIVPFRRGSGEVEAVLVVGRPAGADTFRRIDLEILEAFAAQATIALHTARLMDREQLYVRQLNTLHRISDYIQEANTLDKILHSVLTGVTASYGLGFNRAILLLVDEGREWLIGEMGIGELDEETARAAWESDTSMGFNDFELYLRRLERGDIEQTTLGRNARGLRLSLGENDVISQVVADGKLHWVSPAELERVPQRFVKLFKVSTPLVIAPLVSKGQVIGLFVVDNKFTLAPIGADLCNALMTFASTAAVAIDNRRIFDQTRSGAEKLLSFYGMGSELITLRDPREILAKIVEQTVSAAGASWVSILLIDKAGRVFNSIQSRGNFLLDSRESLPIRPAGISMEVMRTGRTVAIENVAKMRHRLNPVLMEPSVQAAICLPLSLPGKRIGVMWIHYDEPHRFPEFEVAALQLYVNQAAIAYDGARRIETLEDLRETSAALAEVDDMSSVVQRIVRGAQRVLKAEDAVLWLFDARTDHFIPESSAYAGEHQEAWSVLQKKGPEQRGTAFQIMGGLWMCVEDAQDPEQSRHLGGTTLSFLKEIGGRGFQGVALKVGREKLGVLYTISAKPYRVDDEERETALTFANHAALVLKKAKLLDQVQRAQEAAEMVARVTLLEDPIQNLLQIANEIRGALDCSAVVLFRYDEETRVLTFPPTMTGVLAPQEDATDFSLVKALLERDDPYVVADVAQDERFRSSHFAQAQGIRSCVAIPLRAAGRKVGIMFVNYRDPRRLTADEITNVELFANQAAVAIRNAQLLEEAATKLMKQEALADLSRELLVAESVQDTMNRVVEFAARLLDTEFCNIVLPDREGRLIFRSAVGWAKELIGTFHLEEGEGSQTGYTIRKRAPVTVYDYSRVEEFRVPELMLQHNIRSGLSVPMFREDRVVGAMQVHTTRPRRFTENDTTFLSLIANQAAIALEGARQYEASQRKSRYLEILYEASKKVTANSHLEQRQILEEIIQPSVEGIVGIEGLKPVLGTIRLYDESRDELELVSVYPPELFTDVVRCVGLRRPVQALLRAGKRIGLTGRAVLAGESKLVYDVRQNPDYVEFSPETLSELVVPLIDRDRGTMLGVLNVESKYLAGFDHEDREALEALAELVVVALQNARREEELKEALEAQKALAWMGLGNANVRHEMNDYIGRIRVHLHLLKSTLENLDKVGALAVASTVTDLEKDVEQIRARLRTLSRTGNDETSVFPVNSKLIRNRKETLKGRQLEDVPLRISCMLKNNVRVRANPYWLNRAIDILLRNSVEATRELDRREIILGSRRVGNRAEIYVDDNGNGVDPAIRHRLFRARLQQLGGPGLGMGLLAAYAMVQIYDGSIRCEERKPKGTSMIISLPVEEGSS